MVHLSSGISGQIRLKVDHGMETRRMQRVVIRAEKTPAARRQIRYDLFRISHAGIVRGNRVKVNIKNREYLEVFHPNFTCRI
jgi:hypothetical protein